MRAFRFVLSILVAFLFSSLALASDDQVQSPARSPQVSSSASADTGEISASLKKARTAVIANSKDPDARIALSKALLAAGLGLPARDEARRAVELAPDSFDAHMAYGWALEHDPFARRFQRGWDPDAAEAEYRKAQEISPDSPQPGGELGLLLERSPDGLRYASGPRLQRALAAYQGVAPRQLAAMGLADNPLWVMSALGKYQDLRRATEIADTDASRALHLVGIAALDGAPAAIQEANTRIAELKDRSNALELAGIQLMKARLYPQATAITAAAAQGSPDPPQLLGRVAIYKRLRRHEELGLDMSSPTSVARLYLLDSYEPDPMAAGLKDCLAAAALEDYADPKKLKNILDGIAAVRRDLIHKGLPEAVLGDFLLSLAEFSAEGSDAVGYRVSAHTLGTTQYLFVTREGAGYRVLDGERGSHRLGRQVLLFLKAGNLSAARQWLDWIREIEKPVGGDDPLAGPVLPRFWTHEQQADASSMRYAAAAVAAGSVGSDRVIPILLEGREKAPSDSQRVSFDLALMSAYRFLNRYADMETVARRLLAIYPDSITALWDLVVSLENQRKFANAEATARQRLSNHPDDDDGHRMLEASLRGELRYDDLLNDLRALIARSPDASNNNSLAWDMLVAGKVTEESVQAAQNAALATKSESWGILHTLACVDLEVGKLDDARELLLRALELRGVPEPDANFWYGFGRLAELYQLPEAARAYYQRAEKPETDLFIEESSYGLAQRRLRALSDQKASASR